MPVVRWAWDDNTKSVLIDKEGEVQDYQAAACFILCILIVVSLLTVLICLHHRKNIFDGNPSLDIMNLVKHETAALRENINIATCVLVDFLRTSEWQDSLCVTAPTPEAQPFTKLALESLRIHATGINLNRVEDIATGIDDTWDQIEDAPAAM